MEPGSIGSQRSTFRLPVPMTASGAPQQADIFKKRVGDAKLRGNPLLDQAGRVHVNRGRAAIKPVARAARRAVLIEMGLWLSLIGRPGACRSAARPGRPPRPSSPAAKPVRQPGGDQDRGQQHVHRGAKDIEAESCPVLAQGSRPCEIALDEGVHLACPLYLRPHVSSISTRDRLAAVRILHHRRPACRGRVADRPRCKTRTSVTDSDMETVATGLSAPVFYREYPTPAPRIAKMFDV